MLGDIQIGRHPSKIQAKNFSIMLENVKKSSENLVEKNPIMGSKQYNDIFKVTDYFYKINVSKKCSFTFWEKDFFLLFDL